MRLSLDNNDGFLIHSYAPGELIVADRRVDGSAVVAPDRLDDWGPSGFDDLREDHFAALLELKPELVLFGSGGRQRFPPPRLTAALLNANVGVETMDTAAACRTYNIIMAEGRYVVAALLMIETG